MVKGQKVVCINDTFSPTIRALYKQLPVKDHIYTVREVFLGREKIVHECIDAGVDEAVRDRRLRALLPEDVRAAKWNRELVQKGMTAAGREFIKTALTAMGCADRAEEIKSVPDLIDFDEGRIE